MARITDFIPAGIIQGGAQVRINATGAEGTVWGYAQIQAPAIAMVRVERVGEVGVSIFNIPVSELTEIG